MNQPTLFAMHGKHCLPGQLDLFDPMALADTIAETVPDEGDCAVSAADLVNHDEEIAPVSGCRCRVCGHNARRDPGDTTWYIEHSTAYCWECWIEHKHVCDDNCRSNGCPYR